MRRLGKQVAKLLALVCLVSSCTALAGPLKKSPVTNDVTWDEHWEAFYSRFITEEGRVVDWHEAARTVSEGQAYALFFALVANDRRTFHRLRQWTQQNLAKSDLANNAMAWLWGHDAKADRWGILDANPATDADMFLAYVLLEAGRIWNDTALLDEGSAALRRVEKESFRREGETLVLLPGLQGFVLKNGTRTNPSYLPPFQLRYFAAHSKNPVWAGLLKERLRLLQQTAPRSLPPDWVLATPSGYRPDPVHGTLGSYDAVRIFIWEAMELGVDPQHPLAKAIPYISNIGYVPENWDVATAWHTGEGPPGFQISFQLFAQKLGAADLARALEKRVQSEWQDNLLGNPARYYDQVLALFVRGHSRNRFGFDDQGRLVLPGECQGSCSPVSVHGGTSAESNGHR